MDDLALQVSNTVVMASDPPDALTKFFRNIEARFFRYAICASARIEQGIWAS